MLARVLCIGVLLCFVASGEDALLPLLEQYRSGPKSARLCDRIGVAYTRSGDLPSAEKFFRDALQIDSTLVSARKNLGTVLWFQGRRQESALQFQRAAKVVPSYPVVHLYLGLSAYDQKQFKIAAGHFDAAGDLASNNPEVLPTAADAYLKAERPADVIRLLAGKLARDTADAMSWICLGQAYDRVDRTQEAYQAFQKSIEVAPASDEGYLALAEFSAAHGNRAFARETLGRAMQARLPSTRVVLESGLQAALDGDFEESANKFRQAQQLEPKSDVPWLALGVTQMQSGLWIEAAESFRKAGALDANDFRPHFLLATALKQASASTSKETESAIGVELALAVRLGPQHAGSRVALAQHFLNAGWVAAAQRELQTALALDASNTAALYQLGRVYQRQGKTVAAENMMRRFQTAKARSREGENQLVQILKTVN